jgi:hypothetical protein
VEVEYAVASRHDHGNGIVTDTYTLQPKAPPAAAVEGSHHFASADCWCAPESAGDGVWLHKDKEGRN